MKPNLFLMLAFIGGLIACVNQNQFHDVFSENFTKSKSGYFQFHSTGKAARFTRSFGTESPTEPGSKILLFKIDPEDPAGAGRGPEIISKGYTHFGTYAARIRVPNVKNIQPDVGAVVGYFTYHMDSVQGLSEIDYEWLIADPEIIYIGTWTGPRGSLKRIGRTINVAKGIIYNTTFRVGHNGTRSPLTGDQNQPETIPAIDGYDASSQFYTYGFNWYPDRIRWWMIHPETADTVVLWDYHGSQVGIPQNSTRYRLNFWHTKDWPVETNSKSIEKPLHPYEVEIDWMSYDPWKKQLP